MTGPSSQPTFTLRLRHGIWRVTLNGVFFGDYRSESAALEGVAEAQRSLSTPAKVIHSEREGI